MSGFARLRQVNAVLAALMLGLFLLHGVGNAFEILGVGTPTSKVLAWSVVILAGVHAVLGIVLTAHTIRTQRQAGATYVALNSRFWTVRVSGLAIAVFVVLHMVTFLQLGGGAYRLREFGTLQLAASIGLVLSLALHVLANARPLAISLGIGTPRARAADLALVLSVLLVLMGVAFVVYFLRWSVV